MLMCQQRERMIKSRVTATVNRIAKSVVAVLLFVLMYAFTLPIIFFYVAMVTVFQSSYYADLMAMREFALQFFLLDLIQGMKWSAVTAFTMVPVFGGGLYGLFVLAKRVFVKASNAEPTERVEAASH